MDDKRFIDIPISENTNTASQNDLNKKQVFADTTVKPSEQPAAPAEFTNTVIPSFNERVVLDENYAAQRKASTVSQRTTPIADVRSARSSVDRTVSRPASGRRPVPARRRSFSFPKQLCSGETPAYAVRRIVRQLVALALFCLVVVGGLQLRSFIVDQITDNSYDVLGISTAYSEPVICRSFTMDTTSLQSGYTAAQAVCTKMGTPITDGSVFEKDADETVFPDDVVHCMESALGEERVSLKTNISNLDLLIQIYESLRADRPVIVMISEKDGEMFSLQYAVVTAMDAEQDVITVHSTKYGPMTYTLDEFIAATRFKTYEDMPLSTRIGLTFGSWSHNTAILVE